LWLISTTSMGGRSSKRIPGAWWRFGPINGTGLQRSDQIGSVRMFSPSVWIRNVAWFTHVTRSAPPVTRCGGGGADVISRHSSHGPSWRLVIHFSIAPKPACSVGGTLWNLRPSKWSDGAPRYFGAENSQPAMAPPPKSTAAAPARVTSTLRSIND
jgi:hypothetical protein